MTDPTDRADHPTPTIEEIDHAASTDLPTAPTVPPTSPTPDRPPVSRWRWAAALVVVALAVGATIAGAILLTGASAASTVARWAPPDAVLYVEVRADLPGDQEAALGEFLSAFPGFADQSTLDRKLTELYDRLLEAASEGSQTWSADIAPWFDGQAALTMGPPPSGSFDGPDAWADDPDGLAIATVKDAALALAWVRDVAAEVGATATVEGSTIVLEHDGASLLAASTDEVLLIGDAASVGAAIERDGEGGLATSPRFQSAVAALPAERVGLTYADIGAFVDRLADSPAASAMPDLTDLVPTWMAGALRVESDALVAEGAMPRTTTSPQVADAASRLPERLPAETVVLAEAHAVGQTILDAIAAASEAEAGEARDELDRVLAPLGGIDAVVGWLDEAGFVVVADGEMAHAGVAGLASDAEAATNLLRSLRNLATLGGLDPTEEAYAGTTIVSVKLSGLLGLAEDAGASPDSGPAVFGKAIASASLSWAVSGDLVVFGLDADFVRAVLDTDPDDALADQARFSDLVARAGRDHRALTWVDLDALETLALAKLEPSERAEFERDVQPYLAPLDAVVGVITRDGDLDRSRGLVVIDEER
jgi:hypothetical protein